MLLNIGGNTQTNCTVESQAFSIKASPLAFEILSSKLYSNPVMAIVRELLTNAYDSHKLANNLDTPIDVHFPDYLDGNFIIRDYGTGLSKEDVLEMYTTFFSSTKSDTNDFTGCFGLGSKTPFSYTSSFSVNSYFNGTKYYFVAVKKDGYPNIICIKEEETEEPNGLEISIPTNNDSEILANAKEFLIYNNEICIHSNKEVDQKEPNYAITVQDFTVKLYVNNKYNRYSYQQNEIYIKQGQNTYEISRLIKQQAALGSKFLNKLRKKCVIVVEVPIGTLGITPSRESLTEDESAQKKINSLLEIIDDQVKVDVEADKTFWEMLDDSTVSELLSQKYLKGLPAELLLGYTEHGAVSIKFANTSTYTITTGKKQYGTLIHSNMTCNLIVVPFTIGEDEYKILRNICKNFNEEFVVIETPQNVGYIEFQAQVKAVIAALDNIPECIIKPNFNIYNYEKVLEVYPDHVQHRTSNSIENTYIHKALSTIYINDTLKGVNFSQGTQDTVAQIKRTCTPENTLVLNMKDSFCTKYNHKALAIIVETYFNHITNKYGRNFMAEFLKAKGIKDDITNLYILAVLPSNIRHFKGYPKISGEEVVKFIQKQKYQIRKITHSIEVNLCQFIKTLERSLLLNFKDDTLKFVTNTSAFKSLRNLDNFYSTYLSWNRLNEATIDSLKAYDVLVEYCIVIDKWEEKLPTAVKQIHKFLSLAQTNYKDLEIPEELLPSFTSHTHTPASKIRHRYHKYFAEAWHLTNSHKNVILQILRGEQRVLL